MSTLPECLSTIVGFAREECACVSDWDDDYAISDSGLFISELQGMSLRILDSLGGCPFIWEKMANARLNAINAFKTDIMMEILKYKEPIRDRFTGDIGYKQFTKLVGSTYNYYGLRMYSDVRGGTFTLRSITVILDTTEPLINLEIYDDYDLLYTIPISSQMNRPKTTTITPIEFTLDRNYYFIYNPAGTPYANKLTCGCGTYHWCFCVENPCYKSSRDKWTEWAMIGGVAGDVLDERDDWGCSQVANGLVLHGNFTCNGLNALCSEDSDFVNNELDVAEAWAILYKAGEFLTNYVMDSGEVSRYTLLGTEALNTNRIYYNARYATMIDFIARSWDEDRDDCLRCRPPMGIGKRSHFI
jgi:hypothetical protein